MEYTVNQLAKISGVSKRTLRYYDEIGLLNPARFSSGGYRIYGKNEVDMLQQILFYRELDFSLDQIKDLVSVPEFDRKEALQTHLAALEQKKQRIETLIDNISRTIASVKGGMIMNDEEKFNGFKQKLIHENEQKYGKELREKYGDTQVSASNAKVQDMSSTAYKEAEELSAEINRLLKSAMAAGNPGSDQAQHVCHLHRRWLCLFWADGTYSKEAHKSLGEMYMADERFRAYYDGIQPGAAEFLRDAICIYCSR